MLKPRERKDPKGREYWSVDVGRFEITALNKEAILWEINRFETSVARHGKQE